MTLFGIDVGSGQAGIDMGEVAREGFDFVLAKIGQGAGRGDKGANWGQSLNPAWPTQRDGARAAGMLLAGYWYLGNIEPPASQAVRCRSAIGDLSIPLGLDWEDASGNWVNFVSVLAAFRAAGLNVVLAYAPKWYGDGHGMGATSVQDTGLVLWSSRYPTTAPGFASAVYQNVPADYWTGYSGCPVTILQFTDSARVAGLRVDADAFQGTRAQLAALLAGGSTTQGEDDVSIQSGSWNPGQNVKQTLCCPVGPTFLYKAGWFSLGVGWTDATPINVIFVGARKSDGTRTYLGGTPAPTTLAHDDRRPWRIPPGTELISVQYCSDNPIAWSIELTAAG